MQKTKIEWADYTFNPLVGCKHNCEYCYARKMNDRFKWIPKWTEPKFYPTRLKEPFRIKKASRIFVGSMTDLFGDWVESEKIELVLRVAQQNPQHEFLFLTKNPKRYAEFDLSFSDNCFLGTTITSPKEYKRAEELLTAARHQRIFLSIEPLLEPIDLKEIAIPKRCIDWIIVGGLTPKITHEREWVDDIIQKAREYKIPLFLKSNLKYGKIIQEVV